MLVDVISYTLIAESKAALVQNTQVPDIFTLSFAKRALTFL